MKNGLMHMYYGNGKGKTTAAIGAAVRAAGAGKRVLFTQFMKGGRTGELESFEHLDRVFIMRCKKEFPFYQQMTTEQRLEQTSIHNQILDEMIDRVQKEEFDMVILDEITYPFNWKLVDVEKLQRFLLEAKGKVEIICTGRDPAEFFLKQADYLTEMKCIRHPYNMGLEAREGIEY